MKYNLSIAGTYYKSGTDEHATLVKLGFKFRTLSSPQGLEDLVVVRDFYDDATRPPIELSTLEDLRDLENLVGCSLIVAGADITIYNDYME